MCSGRPWRKNLKIHRYRREMIFRKFWIFDAVSLMETLETWWDHNFSKSRIQVEVRFFTVTARKTEGDVQVWKETEQIRRRNVGQVQSLFSFFFLKGKESKGRIASSCCWRPRRAIFFWLLKTCSFSEIWAILKVYRLYFVELWTTVFSKLQDSLIQRRTD